MNALVTGGAGFIGSHLVDALVERGDEVVVIDDLSTGRRENLVRAGDRAELIEADITDATAISEAFERHQPELVFHLAAQIDVRRSVADPIYDLNVNVGGTLNLLQEALRTGARRFLLASTGGAIYGEGEGRELPLDETAVCRPDAPYGQSKFAAEGYASLYRRLRGLSTTALRLGNVYGPRQDPLGEAGVVAIFCGLLLGDGTPRVFGDGHQTRDYVYVGDIVDAFLAAAESDAEGTYNVGTGVETAVLELGALIADICERRFEPEMAPARPGEIQRIAIDSGRATSDLGWEARTPLAEGLKVTTDSFAGAS
jgi:UDP-glucose 4-epimerase